MSPVPEQGSSAPAAGPFGPVRVGEPPPGWVTEPRMSPVSSIDGGILMKTTRASAGAGEAVLWIDHDRAVIVETAADGSDRIEQLERLPAEREAAFDARAVDAVADQERVIVSGPSYARTAFERAYVGTTHRPDRLTDVDLTPEPGARPSPVI